MATTADSAKNFLIHLRLPFQLLLAPFMLWGAALAHARLSLRFACAFLVLHICFYGGTTAFNSHYDKDEGPIGGLENPPPPGPWLLPGSLILQGGGIALAWLVNPAFSMACLAFGILGFMYSHPGPRWKANPWLSWLTVMVGQGMLGGLAGNFAANEGRGMRPDLGAEVICGLLGAASLVGALYPPSQLFQIEEDRARGDRTAAIVLGQRGTALASMILSILGAVFLAASSYFGHRTLDALVILAAGIPFGIAAARVCRPADSKTLFRRVSWFQKVSGGSFAAYALVRLTLE